MPHEFRPVGDAGPDAQLWMLRRGGHRGGATIRQGLARMHLTLPEMRALADALHDEADHQDQRATRSAPRLTVPIGTSCKDYLDKQQQHSSA